MVCTKLVYGNKQRYTVDISLLLLSMAKFSAIANKNQVEPAMPREIQS